MAVESKEPRMDVRGSFMLWSDGSAANQANYEEQDDCTHDRNYDTLKVEAGDTLRAEETKDPAPKPCADDADHDIGDGAHLFIFPHYYARDPACERTEDDPY